MAQLCGIDRDRMTRLTFAIGGGLTGAAAFVFALYYNRPFGQHGVESGLTAFAAAVLGGIGNPAGAFLSGLMFGVLAAASDYFLSARWTPVLVLTILIALLVLGGGQFEKAQERAPVAISLGGGSSPLRGCSKPWGCFRGCYRVNPRRGP